MKISDIRIRRLDGDGKMKALCSITIDDVFVVHDIKVIEDDKGVFIAMPSKKGADGKYRDICHPITQEARDNIQNLVIGAYNESLKEQ